MRWVVGLIGIAVVLTGCTTSDPSSDPAPSAVESPADAAQAIAPSAMPSPEAIAPAWTVDEDPEGGAHAEDEQAAESWLAPRDPAELAWGLGALGCPQTVGAQNYPLAAAAQQGRYRTEDGGHAVALQLRFDNPAEAAELMSAMGQDAAGCTGPAPEPGGAYERRYTVTTATPDELRVSFQEFGSGTTGVVWHLLGVRDGAWVGLLYVEQAEGSTAPLPDPAVLLPGA